MRIFLAGGTGVIGRPLLSELVARGHEVTTITRSHAHAGELSRMQNVKPIVADVYDEDAIHRIVVAAQPEVVMHQLTALPVKLRPRKVNEDSAATNRLRTEGTRILMSAAMAAGARRFVAQSISFVTRPEGPRVLDETAPLYVDAPPDMRNFITAVAELEERVTTAPGIEGIVLRYGFFYGPGTAYAPNDGWAIKDVARGRLPVVGLGTGVWSFVHVNDAVLATVCALDRGRGVYNVTDDDPAPARDWINELAARYKKKPKHVPGWFVRLLVGSYGMYLMTEMRGASNVKAKRELGWSPTFPSWRGQLGT